MFAVIGQFVGGSGGIAINKVQPQHHSPTRASSPTVYIDSTVDELDRLRRQRDILFVRKEVYFASETASVITCLSSDPYFPFIHHSFIMILQQVMHYDHNMVIGFNATTCMN